MAQIRQSKNTPLKNPKPGKTPQQIYIFGNILDNGGTLCRFKNYFERRKRPEGFFKPILDPRAFQSGTLCRIENASHGLKA
jgi:hypothetical protein